MPPLLFYAFLTPLLVPIYHLYLSLSIVGAFRTASSLHSIRDLNPLIQEKFRIKEIHGSEDMALHEPSRKLIFLGQERLEGRFGWFPPGGNCKDAAEGKVAKGAMWMVDPTETMKNQRAQEPTDSRIGVKTEEQNWKPVELPIRGYDGPFVTHGIGLYTPSGPAGGTTAYLHAVNHPVHPHLSYRTDESCGDDTAPAADSRIEIFKLNLDESSPSFGATHLRTIIHPLIRTPNDILSLGPSEFVVTNDHSHRSGWKRGLEDAITWNRYNKGTLIHVKAASTASDEVEARVILEGQHNPNGLGPGRHAGEVLLNSASAGVLTLLDLSTDQAGYRQLTFNSSVQLVTAIDNPFVLVDPYASGDNDISAYVLGGLLRGIDLGSQANNPDYRHPWTVHLARRRRDGRGWDKKQIVQDNGEFINTIASAMLIPIKPAGDGRREGWLVVTGFFSKGVGVVRVDLTDWAKL